MPVWLDVVLVILLAVAWPLIEYLWGWPAHERAVDVGDVTARSRFYRRAMFEQWGLTVAVLALTLAFARSASSLGLVMPTGWRLALGFGLSIVYGALIVVQGRMLAAKPGALARLRARLRPLRGLIPHTPAEFRLFVPLCLTAGFCEELLFRGYLVWVLRHWIGLYPAAAASVVVFGLSHAYQGMRFGMRAFLAGAVMGGLALATGSVIPGMLLHALVDLGGGWITYTAMSAPAPTEPPVDGIAGAALTS